LPIRICGSPIKIELYSSFFPINHFQKRWRYYHELIIFNIDRTIMDENPEMAKLRGVKTHYIKPKPPHILPPINSCTREPLVFCFPRLTMGIRTCGAFTALVDLRSDVEGYRIPCKQRFLVTTNNMTYNM
jgi:hypothetical protein